MYYLVDCIRKKHLSAENKIETFIEQFNTSISKNIMFHFYHLTENILHQLLTEKITQLICHKKLQTSLNYCHIPNTT